MKQYTKFRRSGFWLLSFIASLVVFALPAHAYIAYSKAYVVGDLSGTGTANSTNSVEMTYNDGNKFTYDLVTSKDGKVKFQIKADSKIFGPEWSESYIKKIDFAPISESSTVPNDYSNWDDKKTEFYFDCETNHKYHIEFWSEYSGETRLAVSDEGEVNYFDTNKDYYLDASKCSWFFDSGAIIQVWDGKNNVTCEKVAGSIIKFRPTEVGTNGIMYVKRVDPNNNTKWDEYELKAPADDENNMFIINSNFNGGEWAKYAIPQAWVISKNVNGWSAVAVSEYVFDYNEETGIYTVSVPAAKLRADETEGNGFKIGYGNLNDWNNYYGAPNNNITLTNGSAASTLKGTDSKNFLIPADVTSDVTLEFNPVNNRLTATWVDNYSYKLSVEDKGDFELTDGTASFAGNDNLANQKFYIKRFKNGGVFAFYGAKANESNVKFGSNTYDLAAAASESAVNKFVLPNKNGDYTFTLNLDADGLPVSITVDAPDKIYTLSIVGNANFIGDDTAIGNYQQDPSWTKEITRTSTTGEFFFWTKGECYLSTANIDSTVGDKKTAFNKGAFKITPASNTAVSTTGSCSSWNSNSMLSSTIGTTSSIRYVYVKFTDDNQATATIKQYSFPWVFFNTVDNSGKETTKELTSKSTLRAPFYWNTGSLAGKKAYFRVIGSSADLTYAARPSEQQVSATRTNLYSLNQPGTDFRFTNAEGTYSFNLNMDGDVATSVNITPPEYEYVIFVNGRSEPIIVTDPKTGDVIEVVDLFITPGEEKEVPLNEGDEVKIGYRLFSDSGDIEFTHYLPAATTDFDTKNVQSHQLVAMTSDDDNRYFKVPANDKDGKYAFVLTVGTDAKPVSLRVTPPTGQLYIGINYGGGNDTSENPSLITKNGTTYEEYEIVAKRGTEFRFYSTDKGSLSADTTWISPAADYNIGGTISSELSAVEGQDKIYKFTSDGVYKLQVTDYFLGTVKFRITKQAITKTVPDNLYIRNSSEPVTVYADVPSNWTDVRAYLYKGNGDGSKNNENNGWPGTKMTKDTSTGLWSYRIPADYLPDCKVIFSDNGDGNRRYPADGEPGCDVKGISMKYISSGNQWVEVGSTKSYKMDKDGKVFTYTTLSSGDMAPIEGKNYYFNFRENKSTWSGFTVYPAAETDVVSDVNYSVVSNHHNSDPGKTWTYQSISTDPIKFEVDYTDPDNPKLLVIQQPDEITWPENARYWLHARFNDNWNSKQRTLFVPVDGTDNKTQTLTTTYREYMSGNQGFKVTNRKTTDDGKFYTIAGELANATATALNTKAPNTTLPEDALNMPITLTLELNDDYTPKTLTATWENNPDYKYADKDFKYSDKLPVYPRGIYTDKDMYRYHDWPVVYLKGVAINNDRITPEYQMTKIADDHYELVFTYRPNAWKDYGQADNDGTAQPISAVAFDSPSGNDYELYKIPEGEMVKPKTNWDDGTRYRAICKRNDEGNWELTLNPEGNINDVPFISLVGENWKQHTEYGYGYNTPQSGMNTNTGWQEAWIQYDSNGNVLKDRSSNVMYNTMWPPRNPIFFSTKFKLKDSNKENELTLKSTDLTFSKVDTKTGSEWKADPMFAAYEKEQLTAGKGYTGEHEGKLALQDNVEYTLYRVSDVWLNGVVKLWTGWSGLFWNGKDANWSDHWNWGYWANEETKNLKVGAGTTVPLYHFKANIEYADPTFCKYVDFFYEADNSHIQGHCVLFTEKAFGGAQISASSSGEYTHGNFQAGLSSLSGINTGHIKKVVINSYATIGESSSEEIIGNVFTWSAEDETDPRSNENFCYLFDDLGVQDEFKDNPAEGYEAHNDYTTENAQSISRYTADPIVYAGGDYFYRMTVVLTDNDGKEHTEVVESNPFTIIAPAKITLNAYQLVKIDDEYKDGKWTGHYWTYRTRIDDDKNKPLLPVYELWIENDNKYNRENKNDYLDENGNLISGYTDDSGYKFTYKALDEIPDYTAQDIQFTDKMLLVGSIPNVDRIVGYSFSANNTTAPEQPVTPQSVRAKTGMKKAPDTEVYDKSAMQSEYGNRFMHVTNVENFNNRTFSLSMGYNEVVNGKLVLDDKGTPIIQQTVPAIATYAAVIPTPVMKEAKIEVLHPKKKDDEGKDTDDDDIKTFTFKANENAEPITFDARYQAVRDHIRVHFPNASTFLTDRIDLKNFFTIQVSNTPALVEDEDDLNNDPLTNKWDHIFELGVGEEDEDPTENSKAYSATVHGKVMPPSNFSKYRYVQLIKKDKIEYADDLYSDNIQYYDRWEQGVLSPLNITDNAPLQIQAVIEDFSEPDALTHVESLGLDESNIVCYPGEQSKTLIYTDNNNEQVAVVKLKIQHDPEYTPHPAAENLDQALDETHDRHNYIFHEGKKDFQELRHHGEKDYYYVTVINDKKHAAEDPEHKTDAYDCIISEYYSDNNLNESGNKLEFVVPAADLLSQAAQGNGKGLVVTVSKKLGNNGDITKDPNGNDHRINEFLKKYADMQISKDLKVLVSYLYPFADETTGQPTQIKGMQRVVSNYDNAVLKSQAANAGLAEVSFNDIITSLDSVNDYGHAYAGAGYIDVEGSNVSIVNAAGIVVAEGEGRHYLESGVYVVSYNGKSVKLVVR